MFGAIPHEAASFQPRPSEQRRLAKALGRRKRAALVALPGARGAGKSQLAAAHARDCVKQGYNLVAWINAEAGPITDLAQLGVMWGLTAAELSSDQIAAQVIQAVSVNDRKRRLLVFDNVDDPDSVKPFLPAAGTAKVIVTTNRQEFTAMPGVTPIAVGMFTPPQGVAFLISATGDHDADLARKVGLQLGWLPLGLAQAAAYMRLNRLTYQLYLDRLNTVELDEVLRQQAGADHPGILKATALSIDSIQRADPAGHTHQLLTVLAVLAQEGISRFLLTTPHALTALDHDATTMSRALRVLANASLITLAEREHVDRPTSHHPADQVVIAVHRLTATIIRHLAGQQRLSHTIDNATAMLDTLTDDLPLDQVVHRRRELDELVTHILALCQHSPQPTELLLANCNWAGQVLKSAGRLDEAIPLHEQTLVDCERVLGTDYPQTLVSRNSLASAYESAGRLDEAIPLYEQTLSDCERVLGIDHLYTLNSRNNLAGAYESAGRLDQAIPLQQQTLADYERVLGTDHPDTLNSRHNLAYAYQNAGRLAEAIALHEQTLADLIRVLGTDHPQALTSRNNLANAYEAAGRLAEAIALHEQTLADRTRVLGTDHPQTLTSRNNLASAYEAAGRLDKAIPLHEQTLADCMQILGTDHPYTLASRNNLAYAYQKVGRLAEAIAFYEQTLADRIRVLGTDHPHTLTSRNNLAAALRAADQTT
ncbi:tetratricopeptide repeat protein [Rhizocola hellebori]|uniref:Tetratricopeptide repeat protein n=1 Tax=Rhizocola hellebori TaxID=1392758 RepID=A0A8J3QC68_9ACTN|nr:tetratricopeptide repeat protein [Rhizocola hellebori]